MSDNITTFAIADELISQLSISDEQWIVEDGPVQSSLSTKDKVRYQMTMMFEGQPFIITVEKGN